MLAGPYCGMLLADLGAEVIKIEPPDGDLARQIGPHHIGEHNAYFASLNRNKKSVVLDLASDAGRESLGRLAGDAQALVTNLRPGAIRKLGLDYDRLKAWNPGLACLALTGFGLTGADSDRPAYDYVIQAMVGVMMLTGDPGAPPTKTGYSVVDNSAGIMGALALLAKIIEGKGGQIDVSLYDVMLSQLNYVAGAYLNAGVEPERYAAGAHPYLVPAQIFATADGHIVLFISHDRFWQAFAVEVGRSDWLEDSQYATMTARSAHRDIVVADVASELAKDTSRNWVQRLSRLGLVVAGVETLSEALNGDLVRARGSIIEIPLADTKLRAIASPIRFSDWSGAYRPPPRLGQHSNDLESQKG